MSEEKQLGVLRNRIDEIDNTIQDLIIERANCALEVGSIKRKHNSDPVFYRPEREAQIIDRVITRDCGEVDPENMAAIFRAIISAGRAIQHNLSVAFLGPAGTFSEIAAVKHFGSALSKDYRDTIKQVFEAVTSGEVLYGIVPIENNIGGIVEATFQCLREDHIKICGEVSIPVAQSLIQADKSQTVKRIYAHGQSLRQCSKWLETNYPDAELVSATSNAHGVELAKNEPNSAAIAHIACAKIYDMQVIEENIQDHKDNTTRFLVIGNQEVPPSGNDMTSIIITAEDKPGALSRVLNAFAKHDVNMSFIRSQKPSNGEPCVFFIDIDQHKENQNFKNAIASLSVDIRSLHILGSYPKAPI